VRDVVSWSLQLVRDHQWLAWPGELGSPAEFQLWSLSGKPRGQGHPAAHCGSAGFPGCWSPFLLTLVLLLQWAPTSAV